MLNFDGDNTRMVSLGNYSEEELAIMKEKRVDFRKRFGELSSRSRTDAKEEKCYYCGNICSSFCNSHSIPAFSLKNIAVEGEVYTNNKLINLPMFDQDKGVKQSGTFQLICRKCDGKIFSVYENPDNYKNIPTPKMIAQIAIKNYLKSIAKRKFEIALCDNMYNNFIIPYNVYKEKQTVINLDLKEYIEELTRAKRIEKKNWDNEYYLFYYQKLDYVVPIAFQDNIALLIDFEDNIINDVYNKSSDYHIKYLHVCIFPLKESSVIMMFVDSKDKRYKLFYKQFSKLKHEDKLAAINYIIFMFSDNIYINKEVNENILNNNDLLEASRKSLEIESSKPISDTKAIVGENFSFSKMNKLPNLLLEKYKVR